MARTPLLPIGDINNWARQITQRIERDYARLHSFVVLSDVQTQLRTASTATTSDSWTTTTVLGVSGIMATISFTTTFSDVVSVILTNGNVNRISANRVMSILRMETTHFVCFITEADKGTGGGPTINWIATGT